MSADSKIYFTSDTHFVHDNIVPLRPAFSSLEEMTEEIIRRWNVLVRPQDRVYHLGDFALSWGKRRHMAVIEKILGRLNGQKHLIKGNHDRDEVVKQQGWNWVKDYYELKLDLGDVHKQRIVLFHYALRTWNQMHRGAWMLHGHSHGNLPDVGGKILDVGTDVWAFAPVSLEEIAERMEERPILLAGDHHTQRHE